MLVLMQLVCGRPKSYLEEATLLEESSACPARSLIAKLIAYWKENQVTFYQQRTLVRQPFYDSDRSMSLQLCTVFGERFRSHCTSEIPISEFSRSAVSPLSSNRRYRECCDSKTGCSACVLSFPRSTFVEWYEALSMEQWTRQENYGSFPLETVWFNIWHSFSMATSGFFNWNAYSALYRNPWNVPAWHAVIRTTFPSEIPGFGLCPSTGILQTRKHNISETDPVILSVIHHHQNFSDSTFPCFLSQCSRCNVVSSHVGTPCHTALKLATHHLYAWSLSYHRFHTWIQGSTLCSDCYRLATACVAVCI
jgi:hypothetical protein